MLYFILISKLLIIYYAMDFKEDKTMNEKNLAKKTFAIADLRETQRLKKIEDGFLDIMRSELKRRLKYLEPWTAIGSKYYSYRLSFFSSLNTLKTHEIINAAESIGFNVIYDDLNEKDKIKISIPEWDGSQEKNTAQQLVYNFNDEISKYKSTCCQVTLEDLYDEVLEKVDKGDFASKPYQDTYKISVSIRFSNLQNVFDLDTKFEKIGFHCTKFSAEHALIEFIIIK